MRVQAGGHQGVDGDAQLVAIEVLEHAAAVDAWYPANAAESGGAGDVHGLALLHLDDLCAQVTKNAGALGTGHDVREVEYANALQG